MQRNSRDADEGRTEEGAAAAAVKKRNTETA